jgi:hypothetical protein
VINSTYTVTLGEKETVTVHLHEEDGQLIIDEKRPNLVGSSARQSVKYDEVNFVEVPKYWSDKNGKRTVTIGTSRTRTGYSTYYMLPPHTVEVIVPTEEDANAVAEYVARKASVHLELIDHAWRVRKPFECPGAGQPGWHGCQGFKELLDHDDPISPRTSTHIRIIRMCPFMRALTTNGVVF